MSLDRRRQLVRLGTICDRRPGRPRVPRSRQSERGDLGNQPLLGQQQRRFADGRLVDLCSGGCLHRAGRLRLVAGQLRRSTKSPIRACGRRGTRTNGSSKQLCQARRRSRHPGPPPCELTARVTRPTHCSSRRLRVEYMTERGPVRASTMSRSHRAGRGLGLAGESGSGKSTDRPRHPAGAATPGGHHRRRDPLPRPRCAGDGRGRAGSIPLAGRLDGLPERDELAQSGDDDRRPDHGHDARRTSDVARARPRERAAELLNRSASTPAASAPTRTSCRAACASGR